MTFLPVNTLPRGDVNVKDTNNLAIKPSTDESILVSWPCLGMVPKLWWILRLRWLDESTQSSGFNWQSKPEIDAVFRSDFCFVSRAIVG
jgi:hypothetical protein